MMAFLGLARSMNVTRPSEATRNLLRQGRVDSLQQSERSTKAIMSEDRNTDVPPNHLSVDPRSAFYSEEVLRRDVGIRFNGAEKTNVREYNVAEG